MTTLLQIWLTSLSTKERALIGEIGQDQECGVLFYLADSNVYESYG